MSNSRLWLFRGLVAIAIGMMVASFIMPWWSLSDIYTEDQEGEIVGFSIYGYGLPQGQSGPLEETYWREDITPFYQTVLAWIYVAASAGLLLYSTWLKGRKGQLISGGIGLIYIVYALIAAFVVIAGRLATRGSIPIPLQGEGSAIGEWDTIYFLTSLQPGFYLALATGAFIVLLAIFRSKIVGRPKLST